MGFRSGTITFSDDFNRGDVLNPGTDKTWTTTFPGGGRTLLQFAEKQVFLDDNSTTIGKHLFNVDPIKIADGVATITAKPLPSLLSGLISGTTYSSAMLNTNGGPFEFRYGYAEMRAQIPAGAGLLPTFYMIRPDKSVLGEIDVFEIVGSKPGYVFSTLHHSADNGATQTKDKVVRKEMGVDLSKGFHTYGVDWTASKITFYIDGQVTGSIATPEALKAPMTLVTNLGVGGNWAGPPDPKAFPAELKVDYIKVWQSGDELAGISKSGTTRSETLSGGDGDDVLKGLDGNDTILGGRGDDLIQGGNGNDRLLGFSGADTLDGGPGADTLEGGRGNDTYIINDTGNVIVDFDGAGIETVQTALSSYSISGTIENLTYTGTGSFRGGGNAKANVIHGGSAGDRLSSGDGNDTVWGHQGSDSLNGGIGNDVLVAGGGNDTLGGDAGSDLYVTGAGTTRIVGFTPGVDKVDVKALGITSFAEVQAHDYMNAQGDLVVTHGGSTLILQGIKPAQLDAADFRFTGSIPGGSSGTPDPTPTPGPDPTPDPSTGGLKLGTLGADTLTSSSSGDILVGLTGSDTYVVNHAGADIIELPGQGTDSVQTRLSSFTLTGNLEALTVTGGTGTRGVGNGLANTLTGGDGGDELIGGAGTDRLLGGAGNDSLNGGIGVDRLTGGSGHDTLVGDAGADVFVFTGGSAGSTTLVTDFTQGSDRLNVHALGLASLAEVLSHASNVGGSVQIAAAGETITLQNIKEAQLKAADFIF